MLRVLKLLFVAWMLFGVQQAGATDITFNFTGTITQIPLLDPNDPFGGSICDGSNCSPASTFSGSYTFNSAAPDMIAGASAGSFQMSGSPYGLTVTIGGNTFIIDDFLAINTQNSAGFDFYGVTAFNADLTIGLALSDFTGAALSTDALPLLPPNLASFPSKVFSLFGMVKDNQVEMEGNLTTLTCASGCATVPEPNSLLLFGVGVLGLLTWRFRLVRG